MMFDAEPARPPLDRHCADFGSKLRLQYFHIGYFAFVVSCSVSNWMLPLELKVTQKNFFTLSLQRDKPGNSTPVPISRNNERLFRHLKVSVLQLQVHQPKLLISNTSSLPKSFFSPRTLMPAVFFTEADTGCRAGKSPCSWCKYVKWR